jgi:hypothetical protein
MEFGEFKNINCITLQSANNRVQDYIHVSKKVIRKEQRKDKTKRVLHQPGIEPGSVPWQGTILPLDHWCFFVRHFKSMLLEYIVPSYKIQRPQRTFRHYMLLFRSHFSFSAKVLSQFSLCEIVEILKKCAHATHSECEVELRYIIQH